MNITRAWLCLGLTLTVSILALSKWFYTGLRIRCHVNRYRKNGLAMPRWSWLYGHLPFLWATLKKYPSDILLSMVINDIYHEHFESNGLFYLDLWPLARPTLVVCNAASSVDVNRRLNTKPDEYKSIFLPQTNGPSLLSTNGMEWRIWRRSMNPGFATNNLILPDSVNIIVQSVETLCDILSKKAKDDSIFLLEEFVSRCTLDVILRTALGINANSRQEIDKGLDAIRSLMPLLSAKGFLQDYNPFRLLRMWHYNKVINWQVSQLLRCCVDDLRCSKTKHNSVFSTAVAFHTDKQKEKFIQEAVPQVRMLLIAGNETTTSTLIYALHLMHKNPSKRKRLIEEQERVFGSLSKTSEVLLSESASKLLNQIPYTHAVIKETLRMYLPAGAVRDGRSDVSLTDEEGRQYPTEGCMVNLAHLAIHTNPHSYHDAHIFRPERWLEDPGDVERGAFRPFERGTRDCLGQNLAILYLKIALLMTVRRFSVVPAYDEWDALQKKENTLGEIVWRSLFGDNKEVRRDVHGEKAYHVEKDGGAHPKSGYPCRVECLENDKRMRL